ncbi:hypothetical protein J057_24140 [Marinobacter nanhaiticus D15-8W]|uniref:Uncharacterized protein n=1 Tax=Marinobacter nanhaiticus D15-8W TaxID=626887 RepID=A0A371CGD6_9GAMM|nr:hypothetical protein J057_24140 [Marinobacter nanhaiticus D15-8W]
MSDWLVLRWRQALFFQSDREEEKGKTPASARRRQAAYPPVAMNGLIAGPDESFMKTTHDSRMIRAT